MPWTRAVWAGSVAVAVGLAPGVALRVGLGVGVRVGVPVLVGVGATALSDVRRRMPTSSENSDPTSVQDPASPVPLA